jgi:predicted TIM-barrel fold metal-dependent hydrolase
MTVPSLPKLGTPPTPAPLRKIALEAHFGHPIVFMRDSDGRFETRKEAAAGHLAPEYFEVVQQRLLDFDTTRLQAIDEAGVDRVLLSFGAGFRTFGVQGILDRVEAQNTARIVNDFLAEQVRAHPSRYVGMATLALQDPDQAVRELERCVTKLGFRGVMVNGYTQFETPDNLIYLDDVRMTPLWEALTALDVPLYLHPRASHNRARNWYWGISASLYRFSPGAFSTASTSVRMAALRRSAWSTISRSTFGSPQAVTSIPRRSTARSLSWAPIASFFRTTTRTRIMPRAENSSIRYRSARATVARSLTTTPSSCTCFRSARMSPILTVALQSERAESEIGAEDAYGTESDSLGGDWRQAVCPHRRRRLCRIHETAVKAAAKPFSHTRWVDATSARDRRESNLERLIALGRIQFGGRVAQRIVALFILGMLWVAVTPTRCLAQVQLPSVNLGDTNFEDGIALPGWILEEFPETYVAGELRDGHGNIVPATNRLTATTTTTHVAFVSNKRVLGGLLAGEILQPLVDLDVQLANGTSSRVRGFGDMIFGPGIQWTHKKIGEGILAHRFGFIVSVPTGTYSDKRAVNIGNHFVFVNPYYAVTYERKKIEVSARVHYLWNSANNDPFVGLGIRNMQPGQAFQVNYATSYEVLKNVRLGFNGYWLQQLTDHQINGSDVSNSRERTVGLGPGVQLSSGTIWFRLNGYVETDVHNRASGIKVTFRISKAVPTKEPQR